MMGAGAGGALIQAVLVVLLALPIHLLSCRYWRIHFLSRYLLTSLLIAVFALIFPFIKWIVWGDASRYYQPWDVWLWKNFVLSLVGALLSGFPHWIDNFFKQSR